MSDTIAKRVKKYPVLGGPLDGEYANQADFYDEYVSAHYSREAGRFADHQKDYLRFNSGDGNSPSSMIFIHRTLIPSGPIKDWQ